MDLSTPQDWEGAGRRPVPSAEQVIAQHYAKHQGPFSGTAVCRETGRVFTYSNYDCVPTLCAEAYEAKVRRDHNLR